MRKRPYVAIINTLEAGGANVVDDTTGEFWSVMKASADATALMTFDYGKIVSYDFVASVAENRQVVLLDAGTSKETIVASTRYGIQLFNPDATYETHRGQPVVHAVTSNATLSGTAATDRLNVYQALVAKINAYAGNNVTAYHLYEFNFTLGGATGNDTLTVGTTITQATSTATAVVGKISISSGTWAGGDAAGTLWVYDDNVATIADAAYNWSYASSTLTQTISTLVDTTGVAIVDDAGYFTSKLERGGATQIHTRSGFSTAVVEVAEAAVYSLGIGSVMNAQKPVFEFSKQDLISGSLEYDFQDGDEADAAKTYRKYILVYKDGDEDALGATKEEVYSEKILYVDESNSTNLTNFHNALAAAAVK